MASSVKDSRNYSPFPNGSLTVQGTITYTVQTSSNAVIPPTDSRKAGTVQDCRVSSIIPQNCRT
jgi:hypothetical protein